MIYIIGTGRIARQYVIALRQIGRNYLVIGRSKSSVDAFNSEMNENALSGGLSNLKIEEDSFFINCVGIPDLHNVNVEISRFDPKLVLVEKPVYTSVKLAEKHAKWYEGRSEYVVATNRIFYDSVRELRRLLEKDCPVSCHFEFNERLYLIDPKDWNADILMNWTLANSVHVIHTVFSLIGLPCLVNLNKVNCKTDMTRYDLFTGHGKTHLDVLFSFNSNSMVKGSWFIEIKSLNHVYRLSPMEELYVDDELVVSESPGAKPGFLNMLNSFILLQKKDFSTVSDFTKEIIDLKEIYA
jgi:hypothetical protein